MDRIHSFRYITKNERLTLDPPDPTSHGPSSKMDTVHSPIKAINLLKVKTVTVGESEDSPFSESSAYTYITIYVSSKASPPTPSIPNFTSLCGLFNMRGGTL